MKFRIDKTARRVGFHKMAMPKTPKISAMIGKTLGPIKTVKLTMPKIKRPKIGYSGF